MVRFDRLGIIGGSSFLVVGSSELFGGKDGSGKLIVSVVCGGMVSGTVGSVSGISADGKHGTFSVGWWSVWSSTGSAGLGHGMFSGLSFLSVAYMGVNFRRNFLFLSVSLPDP